MSHITEKFSVRTKDRYVYFFSMFSLLNSPKVRQPYPNICSVWLQIQEPCLSRSERPLWQHLFRCLLHPCPCLFWGDPDLDLNEWMVHLPINGRMQNTSEKATLPRSLSLSLSRSLSRCSLSRSLLASLSFDSTRIPLLGGIKSLHKTK